MKVIFCCSAALSTSLLVEKIKNEAINQHINIDIIVCPLTELASSIEADIVLLAPQVKYAKRQIEKLLHPIPVIDIPIRDYALMDGKSVLTTIKDNISTK